MTARALLCAHLATWTGLDLDRGGRQDTLERLIAQRASACGDASADAYIARLRGPDDPEVQRLVDVLTVGHTWFFRDDEQTALFRDVLASQPEPLQAWIAGTSTGEEAYTIALLADELQRNAFILGTDINARAIDHARAGSYGEWSLRHLPPALKHRFTRANDGRYVIDEAVRKRVAFERHNLVEQPKVPPRLGGWNAIFCRNVLIYFERSQAQRVIARLAETLAPTGWLFLGASEVLHTALPGFVVAQIGSRFGIRRAGASDGAASNASALPPSPAAPADERPAELLERALSFVEGGRGAEAIGLVLRALEIEPLLPEAHLVAGVSFYVSGDFTRAIEELRAATFLDPSLWVASFYVARTYEKLGRTEDARVEYGRATQGALLRSTPLALRMLEAWKDEMLALARARGA